MAQAIGRDDLYRTACRLHRALSKGARPREADALAVPVMYLDHAHRELSTAWRRCSTARRRGWHLAASRLEQEVWPHAQRLHRHAQELLALRDRPRMEVPGIGELLAELRQLREEFDGGLQLDPRRRRLSVQTDRIVLKELDLGPFEVGLRFDRLSRLDGTCFDCVALEPNPAGSDASVTHPHVKDHALCTGEATAPIAAALRAGRLVDAFLLVRSVLQTYNPHSPYVHLNEWDGEGRSCPDCGDPADAEHLYYCEDCDRDVCDECTGSCEVCDGSCCRSCLERDRVADVDCCTACRHACGDCGRTVAAGHFDEGSQRCPQCLEKQRQDPLPDNEEDQDHADRQGEPDPDGAAEPAGEPATATESAGGGESVVAAA